MKARHLRPPLPNESNIIIHKSDSNIPKRFFIHYGALGQRKGTETLLSAIPKVIEECPSFQMLWAGKEVQPGFVRDAKRRFPKFSEHIHWLGPTRREELRGLIKRAEWAVLPSVIDNSPNTVIEALSLGTPVLGTRGSSIDEWVMHQENGLLVNPADSEELAAQIIRLWKNEENPLKTPQRDFLSSADTFRPEVFQQWINELTTKQG